MIGLFGSGEFEPWAEPVDRMLIEAAGGRSDRVLIIPTASAPEGDEVFDRWGKMGIDHYRKIGASPEVVPLKTRDDASRKDIVETVEGAALIFFSGGNPGYAAEVLRGTPFWDGVVSAIRDGASFGGCSAGAAMLGGVAPLVTSDAIAGNFADMVWVEGLRVYPHLLIGAHWDALDGFVPGLRDFIIGSVPQDSMMFAVDENTAAVGNRGRWKVYGVGGATVIEPGGAIRTYKTGDSFELGHSQEVLD